MSSPASAAAPAPLSDDDLDQLEALLDALPAPLEPLDISAVDGFLCGVLLQPRPVPPARWLPFITDVEGRVLPPKVDVQALQALVLRRHAELNRAIAQRQWFDPWIFELDEDDAPGETVQPWVAGFAGAMTEFPDAMDVDEAASLEPLALVFQHLDADDLEDAEELLAEIETLEPPTTLDEAVEDLVRAVLLLADVTRPAPVARPPARAGGRPGARAGGPSRGRPGGRGRPPGR